MTTSALAANEFKCALCKGVFEKTRTDEESMAESVAIHGPVPEEELEVVCHDCWLKMNKRFKWVAEA